MVAPARRARSIIAEARWAGRRALTEIEAKELFAAYGLPVTAAKLAKTEDDAAVLAKAYVTKAIARAYPLGKGAGPVHHLFRMDEQPRPAADAVEPKH